MHSKWVIDFNVKPKTIKVPEENTWYLKLSKVFSDMTPKSWFIKENFDKFDFIKIKTSAHYKA